jgi:hypothetical protein
VLTDRDDQTRHVYAETILQSGLAASDAGAGGLSFSPRRHAFRRGRQREALWPDQPIDQSVLDCASYFVTLRLGALQPDLTIDDPGDRNFRPDVACGGGRWRRCRLAADAVTL